MHHPSPLTTLNPYHSNASHQAGTLCAVKPRSTCSTSRATAEYPSPNFKSASRAHLRDESQAHLLVQPGWSRDFSRQEGLLSLGVLLSPSEVHPPPRPPFALIHAAANDTLTPSPIRRVTLPHSPTRHRSRRKCWTARQQHPKLQKVKSSSGSP